MGKSRHEKRKEARVERNKKKYDSWLEHQKYQKAKRTSCDLKLKDMKNFDFCKGEVIELGDKPMGNQLISEQNASIKNVKDKRESVTKHDSFAMKTTKKKKVLKGMRTKFEEFLEMDKPNAGLSAEEDLKLEKKLAKKLKVKGGKLRGEEDEINVLFEGIASALDSSTEELNASRKKHKKNKSLEQDLEGELVNDLIVDISEPKGSGGLRVSSKEIPVGEPSKSRCKKRKLSLKGHVSKMPIDTTANLSLHIGVCGAKVEGDEVHIPAKAPLLEDSIKYLAPHLRSRAQNESEDLTQIRRRVRGLLNRLSESNVESIAGEMSSIFRSVTRSVASQIFGEEILASCSGGPRGNEQLRANFFLHLCCLTFLY
ncbi:uncharacterized protein LOC110814228 [Carica papaya]|uniref:uncharacterized protein LOC110814228 n=1 Tax=Carica papaya TaxID=3649 RepID=UPI000B8CCB88|nr:uncharacterized protein LOC110814228 [Carica papaya]